jgi:hypothetical protein
MVSASQWCPILSLHSRARIMTTPLRECVTQPAFNYVPETSDWVLGEPEQHLRLHDIDCFFDHERFGGLGMRHAFVGGSASDLAVAQV